MSNIAKALLWASAILIVALFNAQGLIADDAANTLFIVLPLMSVLSLRGGAKCRTRAAS